MTLGDFKLSIFSDGTHPLDGGAFFGVILKNYLAAKDEAGCSGESGLIHYSSALIIRALASKYAGLGTEKA